MIYAHSKKDCTPEDGWQHLDDHLQEVADKAGTSARLFESEEWARAAAWLHDFGKCAPAFQAYLLRQNGLDDSGYDETRMRCVNHSSAGAALAIEKFGPLAGKVLAYLVAGHHAGLPDWHSADTGNAVLSVRLREGEQNLDRIRNRTDILDAAPDDPARPPLWVCPQNMHLWMRMLYSCLVDADFLDTEAFMNQKQAGERSHYPPLNALKELFDNYMEEQTGKA